LKQIHVIVKGRVQGVGFRYFSQMKAVQYGVRGWVRNCADGSVEMVAQGTEEQLQSFLEDIKKGNPFSIVEEIVVNESTTNETFPSFKIKY
jgi:acylphosphatase